MTQIFGSLPKDDGNGLGRSVSAFINDPTRKHVVMAVVDTAKVTTNVDTGDVEPTLRILRIEEVLPEDANTAEQLIRRALEARTGDTTLPLDLEDEITAIFRDAATNHTTGETHYIEPDEGDTDK